MPIRYLGCVLSTLAFATGAASAQTLPEVFGPVAVTTESHIFNGAAWQVEPIILEDFGYLEEEFFISGPSNVYELAADGSFVPEVLRGGDYTTRIIIRRPADMSEFSGRVVIEMINPSALYDWTAMWAALWERVVSNGDIYVGITSKPAVFPALLAFDEQRYAPLSMPNPLPAEQQECGQLPGEDGFSPNLSREYENGLIWDAVTQLSNLLRSDDPSNPVGAAARQVFLTGESQTGNYAFTYYRYFHETASEALGSPIFDGYLLEAAVSTIGAPIHQCAEEITEDDPRWELPGRGVPLMMINSAWDAFPVRGTPRKPDSNTSDDMSVLWELAGSNHGWRWQYLYGDADHGDLAAAGMITEDAAWEAWECAPGRIEVPLYMAEKAMYEAMIRWIDFGVAPPTAPVLDIDAAGGVVMDEDQIPLGGLRLPMVEVPVSTYGPGLATLSGDCAEMQMFSTEDLLARYGNRDSYLGLYEQSVWSLVRRGFLLPEDAGALIMQAEQVPF